MRRLLTLLAFVAALAPLPALGQVVSERPDAVAIVVYPQLYGMGLVMVTETRTIDLPAGLAKIDFRGVADQIVPQTVALQGLPEEVAEQNFDYQLLTRGSLIRTSEGRNVTLVRTNPVTGEVTQERARVVSGTNGAVLDIGGRIEALQCSALPERLVFDDLPPGFVAKPTLSVETVSPRAGRVTLTLSYLATGVSWEANYVARLAADGTSMDLSSWITINNRSDTGFSEAPVQVVAGLLYRSVDTQSTATPLEVFIPDCWRIYSGRFTSEIEVAAKGGVYEINLRGLGAGRTLVVMEAAMAPPPAAPAPPTVEDLGDYKLYTLPEPTTLAAHQTKQLLLFDKPGVQFDRVFRRTLNTSYNGAAGSGGGSLEPAATILELKNDTESGLGLALPAGDVAVFSQPRGGPPILVGQPSIEDTAVDLPMELTLGQSMNVQTQTRVVRRALSAKGAGSRNSAQMEVVLTNAGPAAAQVQLRERGGQPNLTVPTESHPHSLKDGDLQWEVSVPANSSVTLTYVLEWRT